jgi:hypothetical protein
MCLNPKTKPDPPLLVTVIFSCNGTASVRH